MTDLQNSELLSNTLALNVALQTIKERCVHLQKRLFALESENSRLRLNSINNGGDNDVNHHHDSEKSEIKVLREKNAELTLQKDQLTENLSMISTENRKLWKRLSQLTKEHPEELQDDSQDSSPSKANLIRSKTFTQNSPHQLLKEKLVGHQVGPDPDDLEDVSLINDCGFAADKIGVFNGTAAESNEVESVDVESRVCIDYLHNIKKELLKQNSDLKVAVSSWRKLKSEFYCTCCCAHCGISLNTSFRFRSMSILQGRRAQQQQACDD